MMKMRRGGPRPAGRTSCLGGQVMLEFVFAVVGVVVFLGGVIQVWFWLNRMIVERQVKFEGTRVEAGQGKVTEMELKPYRRPDLRIRQ